MSWSSILQTGSMDSQVERLIVANFSRTERQGRKITGDEANTACAGQKLEETCERVSQDEAISALKRDPTSATYIPLRIREIVKETLSTVKQEEGPLVEQNHQLQKELQQSRKEIADMDEKYATVSKKIEAYEFQSNELKVQLESYSREATIHGPAKLEEKVKSLQDELLQVRQNGQKDHQKELTSALEKLDEQQKKVVKLAMSNQALRQQLEESQDTNSRLTDDIERLTIGWKQSELKLREKEDAWRKNLEKETYSSVSSHQFSLAVVMRDASHLKNDLSAIRNTVKRDMSVTQSELKLVCEQIGAFVKQETRKLGQDKQRLAYSLQAKEEKCLKLETELAELKLAHEVLCTKHDLALEELDRQMERTNTSLYDTRRDCLEQHKLIGSLEASNADLASSRAHLDTMLHEAQANNSSMEREIDILKSGIDEIVKFVSGSTKTGAPSPTKAVCVISGKGAITIPVSGKKTQQEGDKAGQKPPSFPQVKIFETPRDVDRVKEWAVGVVKHEVSTKDSIIQSLKSELGIIQETVEQQQVRLDELDKEVKAHASAGKMTKKELDTCTEQLAELTKNKLELEIQLEEAISQRKELERQFAQSAARVDALMHNKHKAGTNTTSLEETNRTLRFEVEQAKQELQLVQIELTNKQNGAQKLELQLKNVEEEAEILRDRISYLESVKLGQEKEMAEQTLSIDTLKMENSNLQRELKHLQETEATTIGALTEIQAINKELEQEKRQLIKSLQKVTDKQAKLDEENVYLEMMKMSNEDELEKLKDEHSHLSEQVDELDKSLGETEISRMGVQYERDQLKHEVSVLNEALGKCKQALAEVQIQRGKLNNKIATMAQEKGDLISGKVELGAQVVKLEENLQMSKERIASLHIIKDRLEQKVTDLEQKLETAEVLTGSLEKEKILLQQEKHDLQVQRDELVKEKDDEISSLLKQKNLELQHEKIAAKNQEAQLQNAMQRQTEIAHRGADQMKQNQAQELALLTQQHDEVTAQFREELEAFSKVHDAEIARHHKDKEMAESRWDKEKSLLNDRITKLQKMFDDKSEDLVQQKRQSNSTLMEQKAQLDVSNLNAQRLETELVASEKRLWTLQNKLDEVKKKANEQIDTLKTELDDVSHTVTQLEASNDDSHMTIKGLENRNGSLHRQVSAIQQQLSSTLEEKQKLKTECHSLEKQLSTGNIQLSKLNEIVNTLQEQLSKAEQDLFAAEKDASSTHHSLSGIEKAHAKIVSDHAALQSFFTSSEKENTDLKITLKNTQEKLNQVTKIKEQLASKLAALESKLKVVNEQCQLKEQEITSTCLRATHLETEKHELFTDLSKTKEHSKLQEKLDSAKLSEYEATISNLKDFQDHLQDKLASLQIALENSQANGLDTEHKLSTISRQTTSLGSQLKQNESILKGLQSRYAQLLGVLESTLGVKLSTEDNSTDVFSPSAPVSFTLLQSRPESGFGDSVISPTHSLTDSFEGEFKDEHSFTKSPSKLAKLKVDPGIVRDAIFDLQKRVMVAERSKHEAISTASELKRIVDRLEEEKISLEARLKSLRSSLTSLQTSFDSVSKQRDQAELSSKMQASSLSEREKDKKYLQFEVDQLKKQIETDQAAKKESESKLKEFANTQVSLELDRNKFETKVKQLELQRRQLEEEIVKVKTKLSQLENAHVKKDAEIARLQQKLVTSQHLHLQIEEQLKSLKEVHKSLGISYKLSQESDKRLLEKIQQLESKLVQAQSDKRALEKKIADLQEAFAVAKKEKELLDNNLRVITRDQLQTESERLQLREKVQELNMSLSDQEVSKAELSTQLQSTVMKLQEQEDGKQAIQCRLSALIREKTETSARLCQLESDLHTANKEKQIANDLCGSLEAEITHMKSSLHKLREDHSKLKGDHEDTALQNRRLDAIISDQQRQRSELDHSLVESSKQNMEMVKTVRELKGAMATKEKEQEQKLKVLTSQVSESQGEMRMYESKWTGREQGYQRTIKKLESKVNQLETKLHETRKKKAEFLQKAQKHDQDIQELRSTVDESITALANGQAHIPSVIERESAKLTSSFHGFPVSPSSSASQSPSRYSYAHSYLPSPSRVSMEVMAAGPFSSTPRK